MKNKNTDLKISRKYIRWDKKKREKKINKNAKILEIGFTKYNWILSNIKLILCYKWSWLIKL